MMMHYRVGPEIPLRHTEIPVVHLYSHPVIVMFGTPKALLRYPGVTRSHGQRKRYLTLEKL